MNFFQQALYFFIIFIAHSSSTTSTFLPNSNAKTWRMNTNFNNMENWIGGLDVRRINCSRNIFSFPSDMEPTVISFPPSNSIIFTQNILFPSNGYFVFQNGSTILYNLQGDTCQSIEYKFGRTSRGDWFDANNWLVANASINSLELQAVPHAERVPCQYDSVIFPATSSFHIDISSNVGVAKIFLGTSELSYNEVAFLMATKLGKIQFKKNAETIVDLVRTSWEDSDESICKNYQPDIKYKICSKTRCKVGIVDDEENDECSNPFTPHGFCCPICGFHLKIEHQGGLHLIPVREKLERLVKSYNLDTAATTTASAAGQESQVGIYVGRYARKFVHIVFVLRSAASAKKEGQGEIDGKNREKRVNVRKLIDEFTTFLRSDQQVVSTKLTHSWGNELNPASDELTSSGGLNGGIITFIVIIVILCGTFILIYLWNKHGNAPITLNSLRARVPSLPSLPNLGLGNLGATARGSFGFARFSNERVSTINIGQRAAGSSLERAEEVDNETKPIESSPSEALTQTIDNNQFGYTNVTYDVIGVGGTPADDEQHKASTAQAKLGGGPTKDKSMDRKNEHVYDLVDVTDDTSPILGLSEFTSSKGNETTEE